MKRKLSKLDVLKYALDGACNYRGLYSSAMSDAEEIEVDADIAELKRRIKLVKIAEVRKSGPADQP